MDKSEITKEILLKLIDNGFLAKNKEEQTRILTDICTAYKTVYQTVALPNH